MEALSNRKCEYQGDNYRHLLPLALNHHDAWSYWTGVGLFCSYFRCLSLGLMNCSFFESWFGRQHYPCPQPCHHWADFTGQENLDTVSSSYFWHPEHVQNTSISSGTVSRHSVWMCKAFGHPWPQLDSVEPQKHLLALCKNLFVRRLALGIKSIEYLANLFFKFNF